MIHTHLSPRTEDRYPAPYQETHSAGSPGSLCTHAHLETAAHPISAPDAVVQPGSGGDCRASTSRHSSANTSSSGAASPPPVASMLPAVRSSRMLPRLPAGTLRWPVKRALGCKGACQGAALRLIGPACAANDFPGADNG